MYSPNKDMIGCCLPQLGQKYALLREELVNIQEYLHSSHLYSCCSNLRMPNQNTPKNENAR